MLAPIPQELFEQEEEQDAPKPARGKRVAQKPAPAPKPAPSARAAAKAGAAAPSDAAPRGGKTAGAKKPAARTAQPPRSAARSAAPREPRLFIEDILPDDSVPGNLAYEDTDVSARRTRRGAEPEFVADRRASYDEAYGPLGVAEEEAFAAETDTAGSRRGDVCAAARPRAAGANLRRRRTGAGRSWPRITGRTRRRCRPPAVAAARPPARWTISPSWTRSSAWTGRTGSRRSRWWKRCRRPKPTASRPSRSWSGTAGGAWTRATRTSAARRSWKRRWPASASARTSSKSCTARPLRAMSCSRPRA